MMLKKFIVEFLKLWTQSGFKNCCGRLTQIAPLNGSMAVGGSGRWVQNENVYRIEDLELSQEGHPGTHKTVPQIAWESEISKLTVFDITHKDLKVKCFKKKRAQDFMEANKLSRLVSAKQLVKVFDRVTKMYPGGGYFFLDTVLSSQSWLRGSVVERRSSAGVLSLFCTRPVANRWPLMWVNRPLWVNQPGQLRLSSLRGR